MKKMYVLIIGLCLSQVVFPQIGVLHSPPLTADTLAQRLGEQGLEIFNANIQCPDEAMGYFFGTETSSNLQAKSGILLTTGSTAIALSANTLGSASEDNGGAGYLPLEAFSSVGITFDACVFEFDFIPIGTEISLNYVFGSEEYPEYVGSQYNDVFAIIIEGGPEYPDSIPVTDRNLALIPKSGGVAVNVAINHLNMGSYNEFYIDNTGAEDVQYDGLTTILPAYAAVTPCETYHLTIAIADVSDAVWDSGIFLEENSFQSNVPDLNVSLSNASENEIGENCGEITLDFSSTSTTDQEIPVVTSTDGSLSTFQVFLEGTATLGEDYTISTETISLGADATEILTITPIEDDVEEGEESIIISLYSGCSDPGYLTLDTIYLNDESANIVELSAENLVVCQGEAVTISATGVGAFSWMDETGVVISANQELTITPQVTSTYELTVLNGNCSIFQETVLVEVEENPNNCVYPGDADHNGEVNMFDLFAIGINFGNSEFSRNSVSNEWQGFGAKDWSGNQSNGENLKYVDCNGNGSVGFEDMTAIVQNFGLMQKKSGGFEKGSLADPELRFESNKDLVGAGEMLEMQIWLGSEENPAIDLYAIAFETTFDISLIDPNSISMDFSGSDLGTHNVDLLAVSLVNEETGRVNVSMSRTASPGANGEIYLLTIRMRTLENLVSPNNLTFNISDFGATNSNEETILANTDDLPTITIDPDIVDIEGVASFSKPYLLYPTFAQKGFQLTYTLQKSPTIEVNLFDLSGQKVGLLLKEKQTLGSHQEDIDLTQWSLVAGVYIVELQLDGKVYREKVVVF